MRILAIDPGPHTGIAFKSFVKTRNDAPLGKPTVEVPEGFNECAEAIRLNIIACEPDLIVIERFQITAKTAQKTTTGSNVAIELIGVTRYLAECVYGIPLEEQQPVDAMQFATDAKLKRIDWYLPGPDHGRDATRHLLLAAVRRNLFDAALLLPSS